MIANEWSGSGGDALPWLFKHNKLGPAGRQAHLGRAGGHRRHSGADGRRQRHLAQRRASSRPTGQWDVENHGVDPDVPVEQDPKAVAAGHDPQLETAVALALKDLAAHPEQTVAHPAYPNYSR